MIVTRDEHNRILVRRWHAVQAVLAALAIGIAFGEACERWAYACAQGFAVAGRIGQVVDAKCPR